MPNSDPSKQTPQRRFDDAPKDLAAFLAWRDRASPEIRRWVNLGMVVGAVATQGALRKTIDTLHEEGRTDGLTGLKNRRAFKEDYDQLVARRTREGGHGNDYLALIDLDGFKGVNDKHGHPVGDAMLIAVAEKLLESVRTDDEAARFGGDEFALLLAAPSSPNTDKKEGSAHTVAKRVLRAVNEASDELSIERGVKLEVTASIGIGAIGYNEPFEDIYALVDASLYQAKQTGKGRIAYVPPRTNPLDA